MDVTPQRNFIFDLIERHPKLRIRMEKRKKKPGVECWTYQRCIEKRNDTRNEKPGKPTTMREFQFHNILFSPCSCRLTFKCNSIRSLLIQERSIFQYSIQFTLQFYIAILLVQECFRFYPHFFSTHVTSHITSNLHNKGSRSNSREREKHRNCHHSAIIWNVKSSSTSR